MKNKKIILTITLVILGAISTICAIYFPNSKINNVIGEMENIVIKEIKVSDEIKSDVNDTIEATINGENVSTKEVTKIDLKEEDVSDDGADENLLEQDALLEQENISYNGTNTGNGLNLLGKYQGLTYYSQADNRWADVMYSSINDKSQTIKSSACGPTSAAMIVSSSKGAILPTTMASLSKDNGFRTANSGTAWAFYPFVADYFDFNEYHETSNFDKAMNYLSQKNSDGSSKYYIIASCGSGLFTTGGHYIALMGLDNNTITVYDPYMYTGKFNTASRKVAGVKTSGNIAYVSKTSFKTYANYKNFWIFSNDKGEGNPNNKIIKPAETKQETKKETKQETKTYTRYVNIKETSKLNVREKANTNSKVLKQLKRADKVTVTKTSGKFSYITSPSKGWVSTEYLSTSKPSTKTTVVKYSTIVGKKYTFKNKTTLYSKGNLTGTKYSYLAKTEIKVLSHYSTSIDYVQCIKTGRKAYTKISAYK